ncbi:MAG: hypothetical protein V1746_02030 [bacterium]
MNSYAVHPAGAAHDLVVIFKGFDGGKDLEEARAVFAPFAHISIEVADEGFDLGSYLTAARQLNHEYICCFNTFTQILGDDWLKKFHAHAMLPGVGIVGATGSYEGIRDSMTLFQKAIWFRSQPELGIDLRARLDNYFDFVFTHLFPLATHTPQHRAATNPLKKKTSIVGIFKFLRRHALWPVRQWEKWKFHKSFERDYAKWWADLVKKSRDMAEFCRFPSFPNPHIRSNAFMIKRERFLASRSKPITEKLHACHFESGEDNMTKQVFRDGLKARIVNLDGIGYDVADWPRSATFRLGNQEKLLVADNQTRFFRDAKQGWKTTHAMISWGEEIISPPSDFPHLGLKFKIGNKKADFLNGAL